MNNDELFEVAIKQGSILIRCPDDKSCHSKRVSLFNSRRRLPEIVRDLISIQRVVKDGEFYVKVSSREKDDIFIEQEDGTLTPLKTQDSSVSRLIAKMKEDGMSDEEIAEYVKGVEK